MKYIRNILAIMQISTLAGLLAFAYFCAPAVVLAKAHCKSAAFLGIPTLDSTQFSINNSLPAHLKFKNRRSQPQKGSEHMYLRRRAEKKEMWSHRPNFFASTQKSSLQLQLSNGISGMTTTKKPQCSPTSLTLFADTQTNPTATTTRNSLSSVPYDQVLSGLDQMYPPDDLEERNAVSRKDGYWSFIYEGKEPPQDLTYGEFDFYFFAELLDRSWLHFTTTEGGPNYNGKDTLAWKDKVIADIGSGTGRLVLGAAALHPHLRLCRGLELLESIHNRALEKLEDCRDSGSADSYHLNHPSLLTDLEKFLLSAQNKKDIDGDSALPLAPIKLTCGSFLDPKEDLGDIDCAFVFSSCYTEELMDGLSDAIGRQCQPGTIIITTDYPLKLEGAIESPNSYTGMQSGSYEIEIVEVMEGSCWVTGGESTAYIHRVVKSC